MKILVDEMPQTQEECINSNKIYDFIIENIYYICNLDKNICYDTDKCRYYTTLSRCKNND